LPETPAGHPHYELALAVCGGVALNAVLVDVGRVAGPLAANGPEV
jgi:hypothetical protein